MRIREERSASAKTFWSETRVLFPPREGVDQQKSFLAAGKHEWNFSIPFPNTIPSPSARSATGESIDNEFRLPPSWNDDYLPLSLHYVVHAQVERGPLKFDDMFVYLSFWITINSSLSTSIHIPFRFFPITKPSRPPSLLRQLAYEEHNPLPTPEVDPDTYACHSVLLNGRLINQQEIEVNCQVWGTHHRLTTICSNIY